MKKFSLTKLLFVAATVALLLIGIWLRAYWGAGAPTLLIG